MLDLPSLKAQVHWPRQFWPAVLDFTWEKCITERIAVSQVLLEPVTVTMVNADENGHDPPEMVTEGTDLPKRRRKSRPANFTPEAPYPDRLRALREVLGYKTQIEFAAELKGINYDQFNNIARGASNLSREVAFAIFWRFQHRGVSLEYLYFGLPGFGDTKLEEELMQWERKEGKQIFRH